MQPAAAAIRAQRLVAVIRRDSAEQAKRDGELLLKAGVRAIEVALTTPEALEVIEHLVALTPPDAHIGAGTVTAARQVHVVAALGASFVASPVFEANVLQAASDLGLTSIAGVATPTEALAAFRARADLIAVFPAAAWGRPAATELLRAMPDLPMVVAGAIAADDAAAWLQVGALAVVLDAAALAGPDVPGLINALGAA